MDISVVFITLLLATSLTLSAIAMLQLHRLRQQPIPPAARKHLQEMSGVRDELLQLLTQLRSERARVMGTMATAQKRIMAMRDDDQDDDDQDDDDQDDQSRQLQQLLDNPIAVGFMRQKGVDPGQVRMLLQQGGPPAVMAALQQQPNGEDASGDGLLG
jgi:hypothetical protein